MTLKRLINNSQFLFTFLVMSVVFLFGCNKNEPPALPLPPAPAMVKNPLKPIQKHISSALKASMSPVNQFDFSTKKDPFKPYAIIKKAPVLTADKLQQKQRFGLPIHSFDVSQFKLIGIVSSSKGSQAMVTDPNGKGYVLKTGMTIGKNEGRIMSITSNGIEVLEQFRDDNGRVRKEHIKISLPRKQ